MLTQMCQLCQSHRWCGRPCVHAPKPTPTVATAKAKSPVRKRTKRAKKEQR